MNNSSEQLRKLADTMHATDTVSKYVDDSFRGIGNMHIITDINILHANLATLHGAYFDQRCIGSMLRQCANIIDEMQSKLDSNAEQIKQLNAALTEAKTPFYKKLVKKWVKDI
jgi:hypothetical protein